MCSWVRTTRRHIANIASGLDHDRCYGANIPICFKAAQLLTHYQVLALVGMGTVCGEVAYGAGRHVAYLDPAENIMGRKQLPESLFHTLTLRCLLRGQTLSI
jgi:hypothetical protein